MTNVQLKLSHQGTREDTFLSHLVLIGLESHTCGHFYVRIPRSLLALSETLLIQTLLNPTISFSFPTAPSPLSNLYAGSL